MFSIFTNAFRVKEIRSKLFFVVLILLIYRLGCHIYLPGIVPPSPKTEEEFNFLSLIVGGEAGTIFAMGIAPYITSSIIMQLLTVAIPPLERMQKEGEEGRKKINQITRYVAIGLALLQGAGTIFSIAQVEAGQPGSFSHNNWLVWITATMAIVTGTMFIMWISELLTEKAIGNGSSFIIFSNILAGLPIGLVMLWDKFIISNAINIILKPVILIVIGALFVVLIAFVVRIQEGERRIPVQYSKKMVGKQMMGGQSSFIPVKANIAGVMSIIFAISLLQFPRTVQNFFPRVDMQTPGGPEFLKTLVNVLEIHHAFGAVAYVVLIFCFTFFYTSFAVNPVEMAENLKKNGGFIPGIRPGKPTSDYIIKTVHRLSWIGAVFYAFLAMVPVLIQWVTKAMGNEFRVGFGGTTLLIVTGVAIEILKQLESQLLMRHYKGFLG